MQITRHCSSALELDGFKKGVYRNLELREEFKVVLVVEGNDKLSRHFLDDLSIQRRAYMSDMFDYLNKLNLKLRGHQAHFLQIKDSLNDFLLKVYNWYWNVTEGIIVMFYNLSNY